VFLLVSALFTVIRVNPSHPIFSTLRAAFWFVETMGNKTRLFGSREKECVSTLYARHDLIFHPGLPSSVPWAHLNRKTEGIFPVPLKGDAGSFKSFSPGIS